MPAGVEYAGYTQQIHLKLSADLATKGLAVGFWNILQLPHGGEVIIPTNLQASPRVLFGEAPADRLTCEERCVRLRADFAGEYKIAVRAAYATGRIGYLRQSGSTWSLVVRNFMVNPSGDYVDVPKDDPQDTGYCVQATNVLHTTGAYCELGYHAPAIGRTEGKTTTSDVSQVWAFRGPLEPIQTIARALLGVDPRLS